MMMLKLLICDDEALIRDGLAGLDWEEYGITCAATAKNGADALEKVKAVCPDIIISDVRMPKYDGIYLARQVSLEYPYIKMIFLTGYNEFEYAKKAIEYNVSEYLSKPIDEDELFDAVVRLRDDILKRNNLAEKQQRLDETLAKSRYFLKDYFFDFNNTASIFNIRPETKYMTACVVAQKDSGDSAELFSVLEALEQMLSGNSPCDFIPFFDSDKLLFIFCTCEETIAKTEDIIFEQCEKIQSLLDKQYDFDYNIGVGEPTPSSPQDSYTGACEALGYSKNIGYRHIIYIKDVEPNSGIAGYYSKLFLMYINAVKTLNSHDAKKYVNEFFAAMERAKEALYNRQKFCLNLIINISDALYEIGCNPAILFNNTDSWALIRKADSPEALKNFINNITDVVMSYIENAREQKNKSLIERVKAMVDANFADDASLETAAAQVYMSPCYLSVIFKRETGMTFKNYLIHTRIEKSKELLANTELKIYEIAEKVGYTDTRYFSDIFQRNTGKTPSQYRDLQKQKM